MTKKIIYTLFFLIVSTTFSQQPKQLLTLKEYLAQVKKNHPILKQAQLTINKSESKILKAKGYFDPKIKVAYHNKDFKTKQYYNKLNTTFKIPVWFGVDLKASYEKNTGKYLSSELKTPKEGLYSAGVSISVAQGFLISQRMAILKQAKIYNEQSIEKQKLLVNEILFNAINVYLNWLKNYQIKNNYKHFVTNAKTRLTNVKTSFSSGDKPAIDTLEAHINYNTRLLNFEKIKLNYTKSKLATANHLWLNGNTPLELSNNVIPDLNTINNIDNTLKTSITSSLNFDVNKHPKIISLLLKKEELNINKKLKLNNLLPKLDIQYNFLTSKYDELNSLKSENYKAAINFSFPLFLRKERAELKLANLEINDIDFEISSTKTIIKNKVKAITSELKSYEEQLNITKNLVNNYDKLAESEQRKFELGEGSLFLINYREVKQIENQLKLITTQNNLLNTKAKLLQILNNFQ